jgi:hypothetical protein
MALTFKQAFFVTPSAAERASPQSGNASWAPHRIAHAIWTVLPAGGQ